MKNIKAEVLRDGKDCMHWHCQKNTKINIKVSTMSFSLVNM